MKTILQTSLLLFLALSAFSQEMHSIKGKIVSADDLKPLPGVAVLLKGTSTGTVSDIYGNYELSVNDKRGILIFSFIGLQTQEVPINGKSVIDVKMQSDVARLSEVVVTGYGKQSERKSRPSGISFDYAPVEEDYVQYNTEEYSTIHENAFVSPLDHPLSTFSIDVDNASYSNMRRFLNNGQKPPIDAIRIEEMINYFNYDYDVPESEHPYTIHTELSYAPWNKDNMLLKIGMQARSIPNENIPPNNLVFLIDVSGSMSSANKLPLLKESLKLLFNELRPQDRVAIVVYAGAAGMVLPSTPGSEKAKFSAVLSRLEAGGSTAGGEGLNLAYKVAKENFIPEGNNRIILASDGDFNVGPSSNAEMERLVEKEREAGIFLTVLGFGMGNYKDSKMELIANKGNGNYAYIDNLREAQKILVDEMAGTLFVIAKDVKLQLEFNPHSVKGYRLIGYENRMLNKEDFNNDKKDAGDLGAGHTVTALYEIIPVGAEANLPTVDELRYQKQTRQVQRNKIELLMIKSRYKLPDASESVKFQQVVLNKPKTEISENFQWASVVAAFGMMLRENEHIKNYSFDLLLEQAQKSRGKDEEGYRIEFINLIKSASHVVSVRR